MQIKRKIFKQDVKSCEDRFFSDEPGAKRRKTVDCFDDNAQMPINHIDTRNQQHSEVNESASTSFDDLLEILQKQHIDLQSVDISGVNSNYETFKETSNGASQIQQSNKTTPQQEFNPASPQPGPSTGQSSTMICPLCSASCTTQYFQEHFTKCEKRSFAKRP